LQINFHLQVDDFNRPRVFLILFCVTLAAQLLLAFSTQLRYFKTQPARVYGAPPRLLGRFALPMLTEAQFVLLGAVMVMSLLMAALNFWPRVFLLLALLCYFFYFNPIMSLAYVQRKTNLVPVALVVLLFAPAIAAPLKNVAPSWPVFVIKIAVAQIYLSAGLQKLRHAGWQWSNGKSLQAYLIEHYLWGDTPHALALARRPRLCMVLSSFLLFFELTFWVILFWPQLTLPYVAAGIFFHVGTAVTMRINYLKYLSPVYLVFLVDIALQLKKLWI
jgi:hypothetical protein